MDGGDYNITSPNKFSPSITRLIILKKTVITLGKCYLTLRWRPRCTAQTYNPIRPAGLHKVHPTTGHEGPDGEKRYSSAHSLTSVLDGVGGQGNFPSVCPRKASVPIVYEAGWASEPVRKISLPPGYDPLTVPPVARRYTDRAIPGAVTFKHGLKVKMTL
jgi:hypothetical protein